MPMGSNLIFCVDAHMELTHSPVRMRPSGPVPFPLRVDVVTWWSLQLCTLLGRS